MNGLFIPGITAEMFRNGCLESIEALMAEGEIYDIEYSKWIPMTKRPMTEEERERYSEWYDVDEAMIFDCELPEDGQDVLVSCGGFVFVDTFCKDGECYFGGVDIDDVDAWMPLPLPWKAESEDKK